MNLRVHKQIFYVRTLKDDKIKQYAEYSFRDIKITSIEAHRIFSPTTSNESVTADTSIGVTTITIPQLYDVVKTYDRSFYENPTAPGRPEREAEIKAQTEYKDAMDKFTEQTELEKAKNYITEFLDSEYSSTADFSDMRHISIGYTEIGSEEQGDHPLQVEADLESFSVSYYIDEKLAKTEKYDSLEQMNREHLSVLSFEDMLHVGTTELDRILDEKAVMEHSSGNDVPTPEQREEIVRKNNTLNSFFNNNPLAVFREIIKSAGLEPTEDISIGETEKIFDSLKSVDISLMGYTYALEFESHDDRLSVTDTASGRTEDFLWGHAKELMYLIANENNISRENLIHNEVMRGTGFEGGKFRTADFYQTNPSMKDFADFLKNEYGISGHSGNGPVKFVNYDAKGIEIETSSGKENFTWTEAAKVITDLINKDEYITQKDIDDRVRHSNSINEARHILNKYGAKEPVPQNIMDIILDDIPSLMKSAVAWDELMEYGGIAEQFEHGKDPIEVVKSYISNNGSFSYSPDELNKLDKSLHCSWSAEDNGNNAVITVNVTNLDTYSKYESQFTMPWTEIADAFKTRIDQERNYNRLADREITVSSIAGTDKYRFVDIENNIDEVKSREELTALFSKMFNKSELEAIIRNYVDLAPTEEYKIPQPNEINHKNTYEIYQIPTGERYHDIRYASFEHLGIMGQLPDRMNYEKVYSGELDDIKSTDKLEGMFAKFNMDRPDDYTGRSLSVSDVIVINDDNGSTAHFVDDIGYKDITDTFLELNNSINAVAENLVWKEVSESIDKETGKPSIWSTEINSERYGRYLWITMNEDNTYAVEYDAGDRIIPVSSESVGFHSLAAAKEWVEEDLLDMSENKFYSEIELTDMLGEKPKQEHSEKENHSPLGNTYEPKINDIISIDDTAYRISDITDNMIALTALDSLFAMPEYKSMADFLSSSFTVIEENTEAHAEPSLPHSDSVPDNRLPEEKNTENFVIDNDNIGVSGGAKARYADNIEAIKTLQSIEAENRTATTDEQQILAKYTGWGAIPQAFDANNEKWSTEYTELKTILTPDEYAAARKSTMNAHYTSPTVISAIYDGLRNLGFKSGKILEPAMGIGNFFGAMPENMRGSELYGVELDSLTGRIAQQLYPNADIQIKGFEETTFVDNSFDIAIGNVPFGDYKLNDKKYNDNNFLIHDYFFAKSLDKVRPGGIVAFVTSKGTLDKENTEVRKYIAERAELLGAVRLPNNAFKANAGTEVTSDIIFLRKRDRPIEINPDDVEWLKKPKLPTDFLSTTILYSTPKWCCTK